MILDRRSLSRKSCRSATSWPARSIFKLRTTGTTRIFSALRRPTLRFGPPRSILRPRFLKTFFDASKVSTRNIRKSFFRAIGMWERWEIAFEFEFILVLAAVRYRLVRLRAAAPVAGWASEHLPR